MMDCSQYSTSTYQYLGYAVACVVSMNLPVCQTETELVVLIMFLQQHSRNINSKCICWSEQKTSSQLGQ
jgi:hypothetical protein